MLVIGILETFNMNERILLNDNDVISMNENENLAGCSTSKVSEIKDEIMQRFDDEYRDWTKDGMTCEALTAKGGGWMRGRVRIEVSFELESVPKEKPASQQFLGELQE